MGAKENTGVRTRITLTYMITGFSIFAVMGLIGLTLRLNQGAIVQIQPELFYKLMTLHGMSMAASAILITGGGFAYVLGKVVDFNPKILWTIFVVYILGMMLVVVAIIIGGFAAAWTAIYPLPFISLGLWSNSSVAVVTAGIGLIAVALLIYFAHILFATSRRYGGLRGALAWKLIASRGKDPSEPPPPSVILGTAVSIPGLISVILAFMWLIPMWVQIAGLVTNVDVLFMKNVDYFFGHLFVNLSIYFAAALMLFVLPFYTKRPWKSSWIAALAFNLVIILILVPYPHHLFQDFVQPLGIEVMGEIGTYLSTFPVILVTVFAGLEQFYRSGIRWTATTLMLALGLWGWIFGGVGGALDGTIAINQVMHNTLWIPAHFHTYFVIGVLAFSWGFLYFLVQQLSGKQEGRRSIIAAILYGLGGAGFIMMFFVSGGISIPRRFAMYESQWQIFAQIAVFPFIIMLAVGVAWLGYEILSKYKLAWNATYQGEEATSNLAPDRVPKQK